MESRIPLKLVLGAQKLLHISLVLINRLNKTESAVSYNCWFSLFLNYPFFQIITKKPFIFNIFQWGSGPLSKKLKDVLRPIIS